MNPPRRPPVLAVTPLEDRRLAATLAAGVSINPAPVLVSVPAQVVHPTAPNPWAVYVGAGEAGLMGLTRNHNETFVRRRRARR